MECFPLRAPHTFQHPAIFLKILFKISKFKISYLKKIPADLTFSKINEHMQGYVLYAEVTA